MDINKQNNTSKKQPKLLDQVRSVLRTKHDKLSTEKAYTRWIKQFILFHNKRHPLDMGKVEINQFLAHLAVNKKVAASTQNQAFFCHPSFTSRNGYTYCSATIGA